MTPFFDWDPMGNTLHPIEASELHARRERVFLLIAGLFLGTLAMLNILGTSRFIVLASYGPNGEGTWIWNFGQWASAGGYSFALAVGVLPYPLTFLCTDIISEFYGRRRANWVVFVGLILNIWVMFILWLGGVLPQQPKFDPQTGLPYVHALDPASLPDASVTTMERVKELDNNGYFFYRIRGLAFAAVVGSMLAYLAAQLCDVWLYHYWKNLTRGKHLWLRNNGSTLVSQMVDTIAVILITHYLANGLPSRPEGQSEFTWLMTFILTGYAVKAVAALLDTIPFYWTVSFLKGYLQFDPQAEHLAEDPIA